MDILTNMFFTLLGLGALLLIGLPLTLVFFVSTREGCVGVLTAFGRFSPHISP